MLKLFSDVQVSDHVQTEHQTHSHSAIDRRMETDDYSFVHVDNRLRMKESQS